MENNSHPSRDHLQVSFLFVVMMSSFHLLFILSTLPYLTCISLFIARMVVALGLSFMFYSFSNSWNDCYQIIERHAGNTLGF